MSSIFREAFNRDTVGAMFPFIMDVDDVARTHVGSLHTSIVPGNKRYLLVGAEIGAAQLANKLRSAYPKLNSRVPAGGEEVAWPKSMAKYDLSRSDEVFGTDRVNWWDSAEATVGGILEYEAAHSVGVGEGQSG